MGEERVTPPAAAAGGAAYDAVPYTSYPYRETHPRKMQATARLMGFEAPAAGTCRVLEVGCAGGGNLVPMGEQLPGARIVGVDYSAVQIAQAKEFAAGAGTGNVEFRHASLTEVTRAEWGEFDYVIAHGVFSWVPAEVQEHLFRVCREILSPNGMAYVSFNVLPGWHMWRWVRDAMVMHVRDIEDPVRKVAAAREWVRALANYPGNKPHHTAMLKDELSRIEGKGEEYVAHEFLEDENNPMYFEEFVRRARGHGLEYVADARTNGGRAEEGYGPMKAILDRVGSDVVRREQHLDFVRDRSFRRAYLCRAEVKVERGGMAGRLRGMVVTGPVRVTGQAANGVVTFAGPHGGTYGTNHPTVLEFMKRVMTAHPLGVAVDEGVTPPMREVVRGELVKMWEVGVIELYVEAAAFPTKVGERPVAIGSARWLAGRGPTMINLRHEIGTFGEEQRRMVQASDGTRTRGEVAAVGGEKGEELLAQLYRLGLMVS